MTKIILDIKTVAIGDKFQGLVVCDDSIVLRGIMRKHREGATLSAIRAFWSALRCSHDMQYDEYGIIGQDAMGNEIKGYFGTCSKCGFIDSQEIPDGD